MLEPGVGMHVAVSSLDPTVAARYTKQAAPVGFADFVLHIIPHSFSARSRKARCCRCCCSRSSSPLVSIASAMPGSAAMKGIDSFSTGAVCAFGFIMKLAPLGAFGAMAFTVGRYGIRSIGSLGLLIATFYVACGFFVVARARPLARITVSAC